MRKRSTWSKLSGVAGVAIGVVLAISLLSAAGNRQPGQAKVETARRTLETDIQEEGPLLEGRRITLEEAKKKSPYPLPIPPANAGTGERSGIWIDAGAQVAFVWINDMRFYVNQSSIDPELAAAQWAEKVATESEFGWQLTTVRGEPAIGTDGRNGAPASLAFIESGLSLQFVSAAHTLAELKQFAEAIAYEQ